ncbi:hypothetical protein [Sphingopyxis sp.]|uniref:hypothetical protein n=1 Tax=Sphingopyxis sp. TaxID=1908224 RepID=UPI003D80C17D
MTRSLLQRIEAFLKESGMPPTVFGREAIRDPRFVNDMRGGREAGLRVECRVEHFMNMWRANRTVDRGAADRDPRGRHAWTRTAERRS